MQIAEVAEVNEEGERIYYKGRGYGRFFGDLSDRVLGSDVDHGARVNEAIRAANYWLGEGADLLSSRFYSLTRALAQLSIYDETIVPNLPELVQATATHILSQEEMNLGHAEHMISIYKFLGDTHTEQYQTFVDAVVKACQNQAQYFEDNIIPGVEYNFEVENFYRQSKNIQALVGKIETTNGEGLEILISRLSAQNDLNLIENKKAEYGDLLTFKDAKACYFGVVKVFNCRSGSYVMDGKIDFCPHSSPLLPAEQEVVQDAFSKFRQEMWRAAHPVKAGLSNVFEMLRGDVAETRAVLRTVGRMVGLLPTPEAK